MSYSKTNWVNGYTPLNASNMNKIEEGIFNNDTFLSSLDIRVNTLEGSIGQGGIGSVVVSGNGNALTNVSYNPSTKILNFEKNNTFALDSDLDSVNEKNLYHLGAFDSVNDNTITRQTGYLIFDVNDTNWQKETLTSIVRYKSNQLISDNVISNLGESSDVGDIIPTSNGWFITNGRIYVYAKNNDFSNIVNGVFQYKLATPYTEEIIENQPLNTLDQSGSQWIREEWEKGLNLYYKNDYSFSVYGQSLVARGSSITLNGTNTKGSDNYLPFNPFTDLEVNKLYTLKLSETTNIIFDCWIDGFQYRTDENGLLTIYLTSKIKTNEGWRIVSKVDSSFNNVSINIMLNEGSHAYPYQEYKGQIVREKELNDQIVKVKTFNGNTSTFNDFKTWMEQNSNNVISVIYYDYSLGNACSKNVIFDIDSDVYKYINSEGTFDNVSLSDSSINEPDIIKVYYK